MHVRLTPKQIGIALLGVIGILVVAHLGVQTVRFVTGNHSLFGLVRLFSLGADGNIPTFYSSVAMLFCALLLAMAGFGNMRERRSHPAYWFGLAAIFIFLALDEMLMLHEHLIGPVRERLNTSGAFYYAWIIPYGAAGLVFLAIYARFLLLLPTRSRALFIWSGVIFVTGALGFEMIGGWYSERYGNLHIAYVALQTVEEFLEMIGIALFAYTLADYIDSRFGGLRVDISRPGPPVEPR